MNKTTWNKNLLAIIIATGVVCSDMPLLRAQDTEVDNPAGGAQQATAVAQTQGVNSAETVNTVDVVETTNTGAQAGMSDVATNAPSANASALRLKKVRRSRK